MIEQSTDAKDVSAAGSRHLLGVVPAADWYACFRRKGRYEFGPLACFAISLVQGRRWADAFSGVGVDGQSGLMGIECTKGVEGDDDFVGYAHASDFEVLGERLKEKTLELFWFYRDAMGRLESDEPHPATLTAPS